MQRRGVLAAGTTIGAAEVARAPADGYPRQYVGPEALDLWFTTFRNAGARAELYTIPAFPENRGHGVYPSPRGFPIWNPMVAEFFHHNGIAMPF